MTTLLGMAGEFTAAFTEAKRELGVVDFHDLEQFALRLLWDPQAQGPTRIARHWRHQLATFSWTNTRTSTRPRIKIIEALSREGAQANRLLVGDVKQSIYRFRLANPHIFQRYLEDWAQKAPRCRLKPASRPATTGGKAPQPTAFQRRRERPLRPAKSSC